MIQDQLVDYINSQFKTGASRDAIKATLVGAGWQAADVEDTLKKVEAIKMSQPITQAPVTVSTAPITVTSVVSATSVKPDPQIIKVSDLVSAADPAISIKSAAPASATMAAAKGATPKSPLTGPVSTVKPATIAANTSKSQNTFMAAGYSDKPHNAHGALITEIALGIVILAVAAFAGFLYLQNGTLSAKLATLNGQSSGVTSQLTTLQAQYNASTTALNAQASMLGVQNIELQTELSFYAAPSSTVPGATSTASLNGVVLGGGKVPYTITAMYGAKIYVSNSKATSVIAALTPLVASSSAQFSGSYVPGSDNIILTSVNGTALQ
jgi:hypothetical protein